MTLVTIGAPSRRTSAATSTEASAKVVGIIDAGRPRRRRPAGLARGLPRRLPRRPARPRSRRPASRAGPRRPRARRGDRRGGPDDRVRRLRRGGRGGGRYNAAICVTGDGVLGIHRKVHQPLGEGLAYLAGRRVRGVRHPGRPARHADLLRQDIPRGRAALALDGAQIIAALSAWPASVTDRASRLPADRQSRLFDLYDCARAAENQVVVVSSNQTGVLGVAAVPRPGQGRRPGRRRPGHTPGPRAAWRRSTIDVEAEIARARKVLNHLAERRVDAYGTRTQELTHARRAADVFDETARRRGAHAEPRRGARGVGRRRDRVVAGPAGRSRLLPGRSIRRCACGSSTFPSGPTNRSPIASCGRSL